MRNYINENRNNFIQDEHNNHIIPLLPEFYEAIINLKELPIIIDSISNKKMILDNYKDISSFSRKITRTKIHRILKNHFHLVFRKTTLPNILENILYKKMSFLFIKSMIRALN